MSSGSRRSSRSGGAARPLSWRSSGTEVASGATDGQGRAALDLEPGVYEVDAEASLLGLQMRGDVVFDHPPQVPVLVRVGALPVQSLRRFFVEGF